MSKTIYIGRFPTQDKKLEWRVASLIDAEISNCEDDSGHSSNLLDAYRTLCYGPTTSYASEEEADKQAVIQVRKLKEKSPIIDMVYTRPLLSITKEEAAKLIMNIVIDETKDNSISKEEAEKVVFDVILDEAEKNGQDPYLLGIELRTEEKKKTKEKKKE